MQQDTKIEKVTNNKKNIKRDYTYAVGRQKGAVARVRLYAHVKEGLVWGDQQVKKEQILVNGKPIEHYFGGQIAKAQYMKPFAVTNTIDTFAITVKIDGGGKEGQLHAFVKGVARALAKIDIQKFRPKLKSAGFLTRDSRVRERRKVGTGGKARRKKQSPKR